MFYLNKLELVNFRCHQKALFEFNPSMNVIYGDNAIGKTSIIESIYCLAFAKSFKAKSDKDMIQSNKDFSRVKGYFFPSEDQITYIISNKGKKITKNSSEYRNLSDHIGYFNVIVFTPEDLELIKGSPSHRRKFMDTNFAQLNPGYLKSLVLYKKTLKERNELLKSGQDNKQKKDLLDVYTESLIVHATEIIKHRETILKQLEPHVNSKMKHLSYGKEGIKIVYKPSCNVDNLRKTFSEKREYELVTKTTAIGPHRDDFIVYINGQEADIFASQGQQRSASLALKLGIGDLVKLENKRLIVLLDDVFSELDQTRQNQILELINKETQIFITTTTIQSLSEDILKDCKTFELKKDGE